MSEQLVASKEQPAKAQPKKNKPKKDNPKKDQTKKQQPQQQPKQQQPKKAKGAALICVSGIGGPYVGGRDFSGVENSGILHHGGSDVLVEFIIARELPASCVSDWRGFTLQFPMEEAADQEDRGFGVRYEHDNSQGAMARVRVAKYHKIEVKFPRGGFTHNVRNVTGNSELPEPLRQLRTLSHMQINLNDDAQVAVCGFGLPFSNPGHDAHAWINHNAPISGGLDLASLLRRRTFDILVARNEAVTKTDLDVIAEPFRFPYSDDMTFNVARLGHSVESNMGGRWLPTFSFDRDEDSVCANAMSQFMDIYWLYKAAATINKCQLPAYFVQNPTDQGADVYYAVIRVEKEFQDQYDLHWGRLVDEQVVSLHVRQSWADSDATLPGGALYGRILDRPDLVPVLEPHRLTAQYDNAMFVKIKVPEAQKDALKTFVGRAAAEEQYKNCILLDFNIDLTDVTRKVDASAMFLPGAAPNPPVAGDDVEFKMSLARDIMRGNGFYHTQAKYGGDLTTAVGSLTLGASSAVSTHGLRPLPCVNWLDFRNKSLVPIVLEEPLPRDRDRAASFAKSVPCGIVTITAPAGTGKTTALCFFALSGCYSTWGGKMYGSGPTNTAVSNFATRLYRRSSAVVDKANDAKLEAEPRHRRLLVLRGHHFDNEINAFRTILEKGVADNSAVKPSRAGDPPRWQLPLSPANWLLAVLRSTALERTSVRDAVRNLHPDDSQYLYDMQARIDRVASQPGTLQQLVKLARGEISWTEYSSDRSGMASKGFITNLMQELVDGADAVMTTPAGSTKKWYCNAWASASFIAVDEAGCMTKADLCSVWGNTLRPIALAGDGLQLPPTMMELRNMLGEYYLNRLAVLGQISALTHLQASGLPVYRLREQLRMANDMFGLALGLFYPDLQHSFRYGDGADPSLPQHAIGRALEEYLLERNFPGFRPTNEVLRPVFLHVPNSFPVTVGTSQLNRPQISAAIDFLVDFVTVKNIDPADIVILTGHRPNVNFGNQLLRKTPKLAGMAQVNTVGTFQGREAPMIVAVTGLAKGKDFGFISDENRLNVMMTRHTSALVVVGDKLVTDKLEGTEEFMKKAMERARKGKAVAGKDNDSSFSKSGKLRELLLEFQGHGRFIELPKAAKSAKDVDMALAVVEKEVVQKEDAEEEQAVAEEAMAEEVLDDGEGVEDGRADEEDVGIDIENDTVKEGVLRDEAAVEKEVAEEETEEEKRKRRAAQAVRVLAAWRWDTSRKWGDMDEEELEDLDTEF